MPIEKLDQVRKSDVDPASITLNINLQRTLCCAECGKSGVTLRRIRNGGKKIKPARYLCQDCWRK